MTTINGIERPHYFETAEEEYIRGAVAEARRLYLDSIPGLSNPGIGPVMHYEPTKHKGKMRPVVLTQFSTEQADQRDAEVLALLGVEENLDELPQVKHSPHANTVVRVLIDETVLPPVLVQRTEVNFGEEGIDLYATGKKIGGIVTYSAMALDRDAHARVTN